MLCKVKLKDANNAVVADTNIVFGRAGGANETYTPSCLIKHVTLTSERHGILEENRFVNRFNQTMSKFRNGKGKFSSKDLLGYNTSTTDANGEIDVAIPLNEILGCGNEIYPNTRMGNSNLKIEFDDTNATLVRRTDNGNVLQYEITDIDLVLNKPFKNMADSGAFAYTTYHLENINQDAQTDYRKQIDTEGNAIALYLMTPANDSLISTNAPTAYRVAVDYIDTTNRNIVPNEALYNDRVLQHIPGIRNLPQNNEFVIAEPLPADGKTHTVQLRANYANAPNNVVLYAFKEIAVSV